MKRAAIYTRVSSEKQTENQSLDMQLADCRKLAEREGYEVVREYADGGYSGMTSDRPGLQELLGNAEAGEIDSIIVWDQSRFGRDFIQVELNLRLLTKLSIEFRSVHGPTGEDETTKLTRRILAAVNEMELETSKRRRNAGRRMKVESGRGWPGGSPPYGFSLESFKDSGGKTNTRLIENPQEADVVRRIFDLTTREGYSAYSIASYLNAEGIRARRGGRWYASFVGSLLANEAYRGRAYYFKATADHKPVDPSLWMPIEVPRLVADETFQRVQALLEAKPGGRKGPTNAVWPESDLRGLLFCECGMFTVSHRKKGVKIDANYYKCACKHTQDFSEHRCGRPSSYVRMEPIDEAVWQALLAEMDDANRLERKFLEYHENLNVQQGTMMESAERIDLEIGRVVKKETEVWEIYQGGEEGWDREMLKRRLADLRDQRTALERRLKEVSATERNAERLKRQADQIGRMAVEYRDKLRGLPRDKRRGVLKLLVQRITLHYDNSLTIEWRFPALQDTDGVDSRDASIVTTAQPALVQRTITERP